MNFGLIGDIHANLPALEAVLVELDSYGVDRIFDVGDLVSYGPFPNEVIHLVQERGIVPIQGNRDRDVYDFHQAEALPRNNGGKLSRAQMKSLSYGWTYSKLTAGELHYLRSLPERLSVCIDSHRLLMVHSTVRPKIPPLRPDTPESEFQKVALEVAEDIIAFGHTHASFVREVAGKLFVNTGSVGRPGDGDPRAAYALLTIESGQVVAKVRRVSYDLGKTVEAVYKSDLPDEFALMFIQGRQLDDVVGLGER
ncbi:metallophosphoesterase family protein [Candidatus Poribacteria bacterium]